MRTSARWFRRVSERQEALDRGPGRHSRLVDQAAERLVVSALTGALERLEKEKLKPVRRALLAGLPSDDRHLGDAEEPRERGARELQTRTQPRDLLGGHDSQ